MHVDRYTITCVSIYTCVHVCLYKYMYYVHLKIRYVYRCVHVYAGCVCVTTHVEEYASATFPRSELGHPQNSRGAQFRCHFFRSEYWAELRIGTGSWPRTSSFAPALRPRTGARATSERGFHVPASAAV